jgi:hypothetical protein
MSFLKSGVFAPSSSDIIPAHSKSAAPLQTAVLFLVFNRPEATAQVFETIRKAKPLRLYVAADGLRENHDGEAKSVAKVREIATTVDWPCEVMTLFRSSNLGCKYAVSGAIDWFFRHEESGIILEDDVVPVEGFFYYCQSALKEYWDDPSVGMVTGHSIEKNTGFSGKSHPIKFSTYALVWGWATWRRVWNQYNVDLIDWNPRDLGFLRSKKTSSSLYVDMWRKLFIGVQSGRVNTWDYQLNYLLLRQDLLCVVPPYNLIENIGFGSDATHTLGHRPKWLVKSSHIVPEDVVFSEPEVDLAIDRAIGAKIFRITPLANIKYFVKKLIGYETFRL